MINYRSPFSGAAGVIGALLAASAAAGNDPNAMRILGPTARTHLGRNLPARPRTHSSEEGALRASGRWSPSMEAPHSVRQIHIKTPGRTKDCHRWYKPHEVALIPKFLPLGTVVEYVNGWGQVTERNRVGAGVIR